MFVIEKQGLNEYTIITTIEKTENYELKNGVITSDFDIPSIKKTNRATFNINTAIFAGLEFYIYEGFYIGTELGIGYQSAKTLKMELDGKIITKTTKNNKVETNQETIDKETTDNSRISNFKIYIEPKFRIGITF